MSVLDWFVNRFSHEAQHFLYVPVPASHVRHTNGSAADVTDLVSGVHYFRLWLVEMFLKNDRDWFSSWHPAVHSALTFSFGNSTQVLTNLSSQSKLQNLTKGDLDKFLSLNQPLTSLLPFNGGTVTLDAGLVAMEGGNDLKNLIKAVGDFGKLLTVPQLSAAMAIAAPLADAVGSLVGATDGKLIVGLNQTYSEAGGGAEAVMRAGYYAMVDAKVGDYDENGFWVDKDSLHYGGTVDSSEALTGRNYMLFRIESRTDRTDWEELKSISDPYQNVTATLKAGQVDQAQVHLKAVIGAVLEAPELTKADKRRVVEQVKRKFEQDKKDLGAGAFKHGHVSLGTLMEQAISAEEAAAKPEMTAKEAFAGL